MNFQVLRLLDASANRAREAFRVLEDYARFILNDAPLQSDLKSLRHTFTQATLPFLDAAIAHRDTENDVGTAAKTPTELTRADLPHVITAAAKRLGEALRSLEEYAKIAYPDSAAQLEQLRYRFYTTEQAISRTLRPAKSFADVRLCVLITESCCTHPWLDTAKRAIEGGADCLQLREKSLESRELLDRACLFADLCRSASVISIINDRCDIAILSNADGVHLGQTDLPALEARKLLGPAKLIGVSTHHLDHARQALRDGADYLGVGPVFPSPTKPRDILPGLPYAHQIATEIPLPALAIAGITPSNLDQVLATGIQGIAVTASVTATDNPAAAAAKLKSRLLHARESCYNAGT